MPTLERTRPTAAWSTLPVTVRVLVVARAVNRLGAFTLPFLSVTLVEAFDASVVDAGYLLACFGVATIPSRLIGGRLADRFGAKATIVTGLLGTAAAQVALAASPSLGAAAVAVVLLGLAFEIYEPASQAMVADATTPEQRPVAYGLLAGAMAAAGMLAGLLAVVVARMDLRWLLVIDAVSGLLCAALVTFSLPAGRSSRHPPGRSAWRDRRLMTLLLTGTVFAVVYLQITVALPLTVIARGLAVGDTGWLLTVAAATTVAGQPLLRRGWLARQEDFVAMAVGYLLLASGLSANGLVTSLPGFVVATVAWSLGDLVLLGRIYTAVAALAPAGARGGYLAAYGVSWGVAAVVAPVLGTQLFARGGPVLVWSVLAAGCVALALAQPVVRRVVGRAPQS